MTPTICPKCGFSAAAEGSGCLECVPASATDIDSWAEKPPAPPEVSGWIIEPTSPDLLAWARQTFDLDEHLDGMREIEQTGGVRFEDLIGEIEQKVRHGE